MKPVNRLAGRLSDKVKAQTIIRLAGCSLCSRRLRIRDDYEFVYRLNEGLPRAVLCRACIVAATTEHLV